MKIKQKYFLIPFVGLLVAGVGLLVGQSLKSENDPNKPSTVAATPSSASSPQSAGSGSENAKNTNKNPNEVTSNTRLANSTTSEVEPQKSYYSLRGDIKQKDRILTKDGKVYPIRKYETLITPNDPSATQWWSAPNNMPAVWDIPFGARQTKIAIIDTGYALDHQEFNGRWAINTSEQGITSTQGASKLNCTEQQLPLTRACNNIDDDFDGIVDNEIGATIRQNPSFLNCSAQSKPLDKSCNRIDDDNNGLIDDYRGWDFSNFDASSQAGQTNPNGSSTTHGTMVAGIAAATGNNGVGIAGVNWYSTILPIQALDDDGYGDSFTVANSITYAADQGADVISISLGTSADDPYMREAVQYAIGKGSIIVAAAGNDGCNCLVYPANYPEVIAVGASNSQGVRSSFSSYGANLDIVAPGETMATSTWSNTNGVSAYASNVAGTSFATPFVSGMYGLAKSYQPTALWEEITGSMFEQSNRSGLSPGAPRNDQIGFGYSNAYNMLNRLKAPRSEAIRYNFSPYLNGSSRAYQCQNTTPATPLYRLSKPNELRFSVDTLGQIKASQQGWTSSLQAYVCIGLPTDTYDSLRILNLPNEINNTFIKQ